MMHLLSSYRSRGLFLPVCSPHIGLFFVSSVSTCKALRFLSLLVEPFPPYTSTMSPPRLLLLPFDTNRGAYFSGRTLQFLRSRFPPLPPRFTEPYESRLPRDFWYQARLTRSMTTLGLPFRSFLLAYSLPLGLRAVDFAMHDFLLHLSSVSSVEYRRNLSSEFSFSAFPPPKKKKTTPPPLL